MTEQREVRDGMLVLAIAQDGAAQTISLSGELDLSNAETLSTELEKATAADGAGLTIDMSGLEFIDSTGIALLVAAHRRLNGDGERMRIVPSRSGGVQRVLSVTGVDASLPFVGVDGEARG